MRQLSLIAFLLSALLCAYAQQTPITACGNYTGSAFYIAQSFEVDVVPCIILTGGGDVVLDGRGFNLNYTNNTPRDPSLAAVQIVDVSSVVVQNVVVVGNQRPGFTSTPAFYFRNTSTLQITNNSISSVQTAFVVDSLVNAVNVSNNIVQDSIYGLNAGSSGATILVQDNSISVYYAPVLIGQYTNAQIIGNALSMNGDFNLRGIVFNSTGSVLVQRNTIRGAGVGVDAQLSSSITVDSNVFSLSTTAVELANGEVLVKNNVFLGFSVGAVSFAGKGNIEITNNTASDASARYVFYVTANNNARTLSPETISINHNRMTNISSSSPASYAAVYVSDMLNCTVQANYFSKVNLPNINIGGFAQTTVTVSVLDNTMEDISLPVDKKSVVYIGSSNFIVKYINNIVTRVTTIACLPTILISVLGGQIEFTNNTLTNYTMPVACEISNVNTFYGIIIYYYDNPVTIRDTTVSNFNIAAAQADVRVIYTSCDRPNNKAMISFINVVVSNIVTNGTSIIGLYSYIKWDVPSTAVFNNVLIKDFSAGTYRGDFVSVTGIVTLNSNFYLINSEITNLNPATGTTTCNSTAKAIATNTNASSTIVMCNNKISQIALGNQCYLVYDVDVPVVCAFDPANYCSYKSSEPCSSTCRLSSPSSTLCNTLPTYVPPAPSTTGTPPTSTTQPSTVTTGNSNTAVSLQVALSVMLVCLFSLL